MSGSSKYEKPLVIPLKSDGEDTGMGAPCAYGLDANPDCTVGGTARRNCVGGGSKP